MENLVKAVEFVRVVNAQAAGTGTVTSSTIDMQGADGVAVVLALGTVVSGAATSIKLQESSDDSSYSDLTGTNITILDTYDNQIVVSDLVRPLKRYVKAVISRATANSTIDSVVAVKYQTHTKPVTQGSTVAITETNISPVAGTA